MYFSLFYGFTALYFHLLACKYLPTHHKKVISRVPQKFFVPVVPTNPLASIFLSRFLNPEALCLLNRGHRLSIVWSVSHTEPFIGSDLVGVAEIAGQRHGSVTAG